MSEETVQQIIAGGTLRMSEEKYRHIDYDSGSVAENTRGLPDGTKIDIVAHVPVERKLVRPQGAVWVESAIRDGAWDLWCGKGIAFARDDGSKFCWVTRDKRWQADTFKTAKLQAEQALADDGLHGFSWRKPPVISQFICEACPMPCRLAAESECRSIAPETCPYRKHGDIREAYWVGKVR